MLSFVRSNPLLFEFECNNAGNLPELAFYWMKDFGTEYIDIPLREVRVSFYLLFEIPVCADGPIFKMEIHLKICPSSVRLPLGTHWHIF